MFFNNPNNMPLRVRFKKGTTQDRVHKTLYHNQEKRVNKACEETMQQARTFCNEEYQKNLQEFLNINQNPHQYLTTFDPQTSQSEIFMHHKTRISQTRFNFFNGELIKNYQATHLYHKIIVQHYHNFTITTHDPRQLFMILKEHQSKTYINSDKRNSPIIALN